MDAAQFLEALEDLHAERDDRRKRKAVELVKAIDEERKALSAVKTKIGSEIFSI